MDDKEDDPLFPNKKVDKKPFDRKMYLQRAVSLPILRNDEDRSHFKRYEKRNDELANIVIDLNDPTQNAHSLSFNITYPLCFNFCCKEYRIRVHVHYWLWQLLVLQINLVLLYFYFAKPDNINIDAGFVAMLFLFMCILLRDKIFNWIGYWIVKKSPYWTCSKQCRYHITRFADGYGGLHSSFGVSTMIWNAIYIYDKKLVIGWFMIFLLLIIVIFALPCVRYYYHNTFEIVHRYFRWFVILFVTYIYIAVVPIVDGKTLLILILIYILTVYHWPISHSISGTEVTVVSAAMASAYIFPIRCPMGAVAKISTNRLEYHVMGITPLPDDIDEESGIIKPKSLMLIKSLGDWTTRLNNATRNEQVLHDMTFYISRIKPPNFTQGLFNWNRVFILVTGVGIAPCIPYVTNDISDMNIAISLLWVARDHAVNYPKFIIDILEPIPNMELYDTSKKSRANLCTLTVEKAKEFNAEAVFIVSNADMASRVGNYAHSQGFPVFASSFDS